MRLAAASSGTLRSCAPGSQRAISSARRARSCASRRTAPSPAHHSRASASCSLSGSGKLTFSTACVPSGSCAGATQEIAAGSNGAASVSPQSLTQPATRSGSSESHAAPPGRERHQPSPSGIGIGGIGGRESELRCPAARSSLIAHAHRRLAHPQLFSQLARLAARVARVSVTRYVPRRRVRFPRIVTAPLRAGLADPLATVRPRRVTFTVTRLTAPKRVRLQITRVRRPRPVGRHDFTVALLSVSPAPPPPEPPEPSSLPPPGVPPPGVPPPGVSPPGVPPPGVSPPPAVAAHPFDVEAATVGQASLGPLRRRCRRRGRTRRPRCLHRGLPGWS